MSGMGMPHDAIQLVAPDGTPITSLRAPDSSMTLNDLILVNGFAPRDGSFRFLVNEKGQMINHHRADDVPVLVHLKEPENVEQLWLDEPPKNGFVEGFLSNGEETLVLGGEASAFQAVYITRWKRGDRRVSYRFSPNPPFYQASSLVYLQVPIEGMFGTIYNPSTGMVDYRIKLELPTNELNQMKGFWSAWELNPTLKAARFRSDITPVPTGFKPYVKRGAQPSQSRPPVKILKSTPNPTQPLVQHAAIKLEGRHQNVKALVCGVPLQNESNDLKGTLLALRPHRHSLVNLNGYAMGMSRFVKVPDEGRTVHIFNPMQKQLMECTLLKSDDFDYENLRGQWVVVLLKRHPKYKRALRIIGKPSMFASK